MNVIRLKKTISALQVPSQKDGELVPFSLYPEQERLLESIVSSDRLVVLKSRQIGSSTLCLAYALLFSIANPGRNVALVANNFETSKKLMGDLKRFIDQLEIKLLVNNDNTVKLSNNSTIKALTAGSNSTGRGSTYSLMVCSEAAYYIDSHETMAALLAATTSDSKIILESTASAGDTHFKRSWDSEAWTQFFSGFESHTNYKVQEEEISDGDFERLSLLYGFKDRGSAGWWLSKLNELNNDTVRMLREYPIIPAHSFTAASGKWISKTPSIKPYTNYYLNPKIHIFSEYNPSHKYYVGVDTSSGSGGDDSCIVVWNANTEEIVCSFTDNNTKIDQLCDVISVINQMYSAKLIFIEKNGVGEGTLAICRTRGLPVFSHVTTNTNRYIGYLDARNRIDKGLCADEHLVENCNSCTVSENDSKVKFSGRKDYLSALSFIFSNYSIIKEEISKPPERVIGPNQFDGLALLRSNKSKSGILGARR